VCLFSLRLFVRLGSHIDNFPCIVFGRSSCQLTLHYIWAPIFLRLFVCLGTHLSNSPSIVFGRPSCYGCSCVWAPILSNFLELHLGTPLAKFPFLSFGKPQFIFPTTPMLLALLVLFVGCSPYLWEPILPTFLALPLKTQIFYSHHTCVTGSFGFFGWALLLPLGTPLSNLPCIASRNPKFSFHSRNPKLFYPPHLCRWLF
jgi:hypothetical protein